MSMIFLGSMAAWVQSSQTIVGAQALPSAILTITFMVAAGRSPFLIGCEEMFGCLLCFSHNARTGDMMGFAGLDAWVASSKKGALIAIGISPEEQQALLRSSTCLCCKIREDSTKRAVLELASIDVGILRAAVRESVLEIVGTSCSSADPGLEQYIVHGREIPPRL